MFNTLECESADELWLEASKWFEEGGIADSQTSQHGQNAEVLNAGLSLKNPRDRWVAARTPTLNIAFAIAEVIWILTGRKDSKFLTYFNNSLTKYVGTDNDYHGAYGYRLRSHFGIDQIDRVAEVLEASVNSRQVVLQIWDSNSDLPNSNGISKAKDIPCNVCALLKVRNSKLEWTQIMRSNDFYRGLPYNLVQFTTLQEVIAGRLGLGIGTYHQLSHSLHLYTTDGEISPMRSLNNLPGNIDSLSLPKIESERAFEELGKFGDFLVNGGINSSDWKSRLKNIEVPAAFANLAAVLSAEALRRKGKDPQEALGYCSNPCFKALFEKWLDRFVH